MADLSCNICAHDDHFCTECGDPLEHDAGTICNWCAFWYDFEPLGDE